MAQHVDIGDRLTAIGDHHRDIDQDPAPVVQGHERAPGQGLGQLTGQAGPITHETESDAARVGHHADTVARY